MIANGNGQFASIATLEQATGTNRDNSTELWFFLSRVRQDNSACRCFFCVNQFDNNSIIKWPEFFFRHHIFLYHKQGMFYLEINVYKRPTTSCRAYRPCHPCHPCRACHHPCRACHHPYHPCRAYHRPCHDRGDRQRPHPLALGYR